MKQPSIFILNAMECSVCYETGTCRKLCCGHEFCSGCIKSWYLKGTGTGCPMCRRPIYFKGFHKLRDTWDVESHDNKCNEVLNNTFDMRIQNVIESAQIFPEQFRRHIVGTVMQELKETEKMFRFLVAEGCNADEIDCFLNESDYYFSDRNINKFLWWDDPVIKEHATQYPMVQQAKGSRCREGQGGLEWETLVMLWIV